MSHSTIIFVDLPSLRASDAPQSTIPLDILITSSRPDMVIIDHQARTLSMLELTVCGNTPEAISAAQTRKANKSEHLGIVSDLNRLGWNAKYGTIEIGALGHYNPTAPATLKDVLPWISSLDWKEILTVAGKIAINCSQAIFFARSNTRLYNSLLRGNS